MHSHMHGIMYVQVIFATCFGNLIRDDPTDVFSNGTKESHEQESEFHKGQTEIIISEFLRNL